METNYTAFNQEQTLHDIKHYLPAQAPLKDFIHHNTLHAFQHLNFQEGLQMASETFGYKVALSLEEFQDLYKSGRIREDILRMVIAERKGEELIDEWKQKILKGGARQNTLARIGQLRANWKKQYQIDLDSQVHPKLFRIIGSFLDQGISIWSFPDSNRPFLEAIREVEKNSFVSIFRSKRVKSLLHNPGLSLTGLLQIVVGNERLFQHYLYDQQFAHQGWSGMVSVIEDQPQSLLDKREISLHDLIVFELLLEIDALDSRFGKKWNPLATGLFEKPIDLFGPIFANEFNEVQSIWQEAFEWTYYDQVLAGMQREQKGEKIYPTRTFQAMFCIDDRECSFRRYLEQQDSACETFGTPGFFSVEFFFQPEHSKFYTKQCPAPVSPKFLIKELETKNKRAKERVFTKHTNSLIPGWIISQTFGYWTAVKLALNIFKPAMSPATASSFHHMDKVSSLTIENTNQDHRENELQIGFTIPEMATRVENLLRSIGLIKTFAPIIYVVGHGASSVNNPHYAAYDCGACSGRPGSVNARVISFMANHPKVRELLRTKDILIPEETQFVGCLHDTTRDDITFYDEQSLSAENTLQHSKHHKVFEQALDKNSKERARRFESISGKQSLKKIHAKIRQRSVSLFEPRPELNHATNAITIVGRRQLSKGLFLDRRSFLNSYDYRTDPKGAYLLNILKAAVPVCGGINLEYFFSRVDNQKLGAGTKLPHNVMGLFGVANGIDGDLRPGLPSQMIEVHDPIRMLFIVEQFPEVVLDVIKQSPETYEWIRNKWVHLVVVNPENQEISLFRDGQFTPYTPHKKNIKAIKDLNLLLESEQENFPVYLIS